jgi:quinolinate synthase
MGIEATTVQETYKKMQAKLSKVVPDVELRIKAELVYEINRLKKERGALILGHNYMEPALFHTVPDIVGDSLELSRKAAETTCDPIIFCGVRFMAETAKILNPTKTVLLPARVAGCSLASSISAADVRALKKRFPGVPVVSYINTYADVKAESDVICTSGNAVRIVKSLGAERIIFLPDQFLAANVAKECGMDIVFPGPNDSVDRSNVMIGWNGACEVHERFTVDDIVNIRKQFPGVAVLAHPECPPQVVAASDFSQSTSRMVEFVKSSEAPHFLLLTECSMADNIIAENPTKDVLRLCSIRCPHMNEITLEDTLRALRDNEQQIEVPHDIAARARVSLERMLAVR